MTNEQLLLEAGVAYEKAMALFSNSDLEGAKSGFLQAFRSCRKCSNDTGQLISDSAFYLALCTTETESNREDLLEAEDLLIRHIRDNETVCDGIPRICVLGKVYTQLGRSKLMRLLCKEQIQMATTSEEKAYALAGAAYAAPTTDAYTYGMEALPLLRSMGNRSESMIIVLEALARAVENVSYQERLVFVEELLRLLSELPPHPMILSRSEAHMLMSYLYMEQAQWNDALQASKLALFYSTPSTTKSRSSVLELASIYRHMEKLYDMVDDPKEAAICRFNALKEEVIVCPDLYGYAVELEKVADRLAHICEYKLATSAQLLSLRCLVDSDDPTYDQIRRSVITLQGYERNVQ